MEAKMISLTNKLLDENDKELVRFLAKRFLNRDISNRDIIGYVEFPHYQDLGCDKILEQCERLNRCGLLQTFSNNGETILPTVLELVEYWDNPPLPNLKDELIKWFWSRPWSVVVFVVVVGLPLLVTWVSMLKTLLEWLGIKK